jgi:uncharacterized protein YacL
MVLHVIRALFLVVVLSIIISFAVQPDIVKEGPEYVTAYILGPALGMAAVVFIDMFWRHKQLQLLSGLFFGILAGLAIAYVITLVVNLVFGVFPNLVDRKVVELLKVLLGASAVFFCVSFVLQTKDDFRFVIPYVEFSREAKGARPVLLDTSVIIDGRIADMAETGVFESQLLVPRFILGELQTIADSEDKLRRNRGRRGLDVLNRLQGNDQIDIRIMDSRAREVADAPDPDAKLVALARHLNARVITNDFNLNKVARLRGVDVININRLANALKPIVLPGEKMTVKVIKPGEEPGQGVGYLDDGTMVVAEHGREHIGREIGITVTSVLQTSAGRMIFGRLDAERTFGRERRS